MFRRLVVQGVEDKIGAVGRRPPRRIQDQIVVAWLAGIDVKVLAEETASLPIELVELAGSRPVIEAASAAKGGDTVFAVADQAHAQRSMRRQKKLGPPTDDQTAALLAQGTNHGDEMAEIAAFT